MTIHLIANRFAGKGVKPLRRLLADQPIEWHLPGDVDEASELIRSLRGHAQRLVFAGGDGTFHLASRVLGDGQTPDQVGFIATGTGSDFLRSLGAGSLEEQVATRCRARRGRFAWGRRRRRLAIVHQCGIARC